MDDISIEMTYPPPPQEQIERLQERFARMPRKSVLRNKVAPKIRFRSKLGRNDPCHCGSGRKLKHCCMRSALAQRHALNFGISNDLPARQEL